jgi:predicted ATPase
VPEAGRAIIQDQVAIGGEALPWSDRRAFAELMLCREMRSYRPALRLSGPVIFDRGVPDVLGYLHLSNLPIPSHVERAAQIFRYIPKRLSRRLGVRSSGSMRNGSKLSRKRKRRTK